MLARLRFPIAVLLTSLALVATIGLSGLVLVRSALASGPAMGRPGLADTLAAHGQLPGIPAELESLAAIPPAERFSHFLGAQLNLKDRNNQPLTISATPGSVTAISPTSLTIAANDGATRTFLLTPQTVIRSKRIGASNQMPAQGDLAVVFTLNASNTATSVALAGPEGFHPRWEAGRIGPNR